MVFSLIVREITTHDGRVFTGAKGCFQDVDHGIEYCRGFWCTDTIYREQIASDRTLINFRIVPYLLIIIPFLLFAPSIVAYAPIAISNFLDNQQQTDQSHEDGKLSAWLNLN